MTAKSHLWSAVPVHSLSDKHALELQSKGISPKVTAATLGGALATILWALIAGYVPGLKEHLGGDTGITAITGASATLFAFALGYLVPDPLRTATTGENIGERHR